ncbi:MAG TPA: response regulator transcription factor, partial [Chroococcales cyanobacterium]
MTEPIKIFIVEDNEMTRLAIKGSLAKSEGFAVVGEAGDGQSAVDQIKSLSPDVILVDIGLPVLDGISATKQIKLDHPKIRALMLTAHESDRDIFNSFDAGADGYLIKDGFAQRLDLAIRSVNDGVAWLDPRIAQRVLKAAAVTMRSAVVAEGPAEHEPVEPLSEHESDVLQKVAAHEPMCKDGVCLIDPGFMQKLHR